MCIVSSKEENPYFDVRGMQGNFSLESGGRTDDSQADNSFIPIKLKNIYFKCDNI